MLPGALIGDWALIWIFTVLEFAAKEVGPLPDKLNEEMGKFGTEKEMTNGYYGFDVLFKEPVPVKKNETYEIRAVISGPTDSYYGEQGQVQVTVN